mgnify:CR=1 FL=1
MAFPGASIATDVNSINKILKEFYLGPIQNQLNNEVMVLDMFEKAKISWAGKQGVVPLHVGRNSTVDFKSESADLPAAGTRVSAIAAKRTAPVSLVPV